MRIFRYWSRVEQTIEIDGVSRRLHGYGGSNASRDDATRDAETRLAWVRGRIAGAPPREPDYEADIREEIVASIDDRNIVTRNRYGAEVLNSAEVMFVDIDEPRYRFWEVFFGIRSTKRRKERIVEFVKTRAAAPELRGLGWRIYETHKGVRVTITGRKFDPKAKTTQQLLRSLNADRLYAALCRKQGCFRARLTPKPHRMKYRAHRVVFPRADEAAEGAFREWLAGYEQARKNYATCKLLCTLGPEHRDAVIDYHDRTTGVAGSLKLA